MLETTGNLWTFHEEHFIVIPTNGIVTKAGKLVMGAGLALEARERFPGLDTVLGSLVKRHGNVPVIVVGLGLGATSYRIATFPTKHRWSDIYADLDLIERSADHLCQLWEGKEQLIYLPMVGCGYGRLRWEEVRPILEKRLDDRFIVVIGDKRQEQAA